MNIDDEYIISYQIYEKYEIHALLLIPIIFVVGTKRYISVKEYQNMQKKIDNYMQQFSQNDDLIVNYRPWKTLQSYDNDDGDGDGPILDEGPTKLQGSGGKGMLVSNFHFILSELCM